MRTRNAAQPSEGPGETAHNLNLLLIISADKNDHDLLRSVFSDCLIDSAFSIGAAIKRLHDECPAVVISERDLPDGNWKQILYQIASHPIPPALIVTSRLADELLWAEVLNLGGFDVLAKPLDRGELLRVVGQAYRRFRNELEERARRRAYLVARAGQGS